MREAVFVALAVLVATPAWSYSEKDLAKFEALNSCKNCDLRGADLRGGNLNEAILCKTKMPWGEETSGCK